MDTISLGPGVPAKKSGSNTTLYIILFLCCVISIMAGTFHFMMGRKDASAAKKLKELEEKAQAEQAAIKREAQSQMEKARSEEEKREIQRKAQIASERAAMKAKAAAAEQSLIAKQRAGEQALAARRAQDSAAFKRREAQVKRAEARVQKELDSAAAAVRKSRDLKRKAGIERTAALKKLQDARNAMAHAQRTKRANDIKLAQEKRRIAHAAAVKVRHAQKQAAAARKHAHNLARHAHHLNNRLRHVTARLHGKSWSMAQGYNAVPGYTGGYWKEMGRHHNPHVCAMWARWHNTHMWGHRGLNHPNKRYKNTCWAYKPGYRPRFRGRNDDIHLTGCSFGGHPSRGCSYYPMVQMGEHNHLRGHRWRYNGGRRDINYLGNWWNDKVSSIYVPKNTWLGVYEHGNWRGRGWGIRGPAYLRGIGWWNDRISSVRIRHF